VRVIESFDAVRIKFVQVVPWGNKTLCANLDRAHPNRPAYLSMIVDNIVDIPKESSLR
jgi:hypothetical protein